MGCNCGCGNCDEAKAAEILNRDPMPFLRVTVANHSEEPMVLIGTETGTNYLARRNGEQLNVRREDVYAQPDKFLL